MKSIGAWLMIIFGSVLVVGGLGESTVTVGGARVCGGNGQIGTEQVCAVGSIQVNKTVVGDGTPPPGGWDVTISSANCTSGLAGRTDLTANIPAAGGSATFANLFVSTDITDLTACQYSLTETPVTGWTPTFVPAGPTYTVVNNQTIVIALTNTSPMATTTTAAPATTTTTTTTIAATTTTAAATTTTVGPTTTVAAATTLAATTTVAAVAPTVPGGGALPETGSRSTGSITYVGGALILLGGLILISRRRTRSTTSD